LIDTLVNRTGERRGLSPPFSSFYAKLNSHLLGYLRQPAEGLAYRQALSAREAARSIRMSSKAAVTDQPVMNRWIVVVGAILIQLALGAIYAWSVFTPSLQASPDKGGYGFTASQTQWIFSAGLATFALVMLFAGRWQARIGPRKAAIIAGLVLGTGYILGGLLGKTFAMQLLCIGVIGGGGIGLGYVVPIACGVKWFPDKKGLITGLAVAGFGFGATLWVKLGDSWVWQGGLLSRASGMFGLPGIQAVFIIYGIAFLALVLLGSTVMVNPPTGWKPSGWNPQTSTIAGTKVEASADYTTSQMIGTTQFWGLLLMFAGSAMAGLMVIGCIKLFGIDSLKANGFGGDSAATAGTAMAWFAIFNGLGRIVWGMASDKLGRRTSLLLMCLIQGLMMLSFFKIGSSEFGLIVGASIIGFNFGGNFALFPAATADFFGNKNVGVNYPWVFLAYGIAGIAGPQIAGYFKDAAKLSGAGVLAWKTPFIIAGITCLVAAGMSLLLKAPKAPTVVLEEATAADILTRHGSEVRKHPEQTNIKK
jgi:MFS family permease